MRFPVAVVVTLVCSCVHAGGTASSSADFAYARELRELFQAISDLENTSGGAREAQLLVTSFQVACANYAVSCERAHWQEPWTSRGEVGKDLAHAIASLDRVYAVWARNPDGRNERAVQQIGDARRGVRELLFAREHGGRTPAHSDAMIAAQELRYARSLVEDAPQGAAIQQQLAVIDAHWPDRTATALFPPSPDDFSDLYYAGRLFVARDLVDHALAAIRRDRAYREEHGRGPLSGTEQPLGDARDGLAQLAVATQAQ